MSSRTSLGRRVAFALIAHAKKMMPPSRSLWADAMEHELQHIEGGLELLRWAAGCVIATYIERGGRTMDQSFGTIVRKPSAFVPLAMSVTALALLGGAQGGLLREPDEGSIAHLWQLLLAGQLPVLAFFAIKWLPQAPKQALCVLALQGGAVLAAMAPVYFLNL